MADGVVDIPLPGRAAWAEQEDQGGAAPCHFLAGPENRLVEVAVESVLAGVVDAASCRVQGRGGNGQALVPGPSPEDAQALTPGPSPDGRGEKDAASTYNPLVLFGPSGTGKSHLAQGLAAVWKAHDRRHRVVSTTAVDFARELAEAIESQGVDEFRTKYRTAGLLVFEDLGQLATRRSGKLSAQEELIHTLDAMVAEGRWVVVTASASPAELPGILPALQSRLLAGLTVPLKPPGSEARQAVLRQLAAARHLELPAEVLELLANGLAGTVPEMAGVLLHIAMRAELDGEGVTLAGAQRYLAARRRKQHQPSLHEIALATARHFSLRLADLRSPVRQRALVTARGVAVYLARHCAHEGFQEIGRYFGGRDHTTILHSCRQAEKMLESDPAVRKAVEQLRKELWKT